MANSMPGKRHLKRLSSPTIMLEPSEFARTSVQYNRNCTIENPPARLAGQFRVPGTPGLRQAASSSRRHGKPHIIISALQTRHISNLNTSNPANPGYDWDGVSAAAPALQSGEYALESGRISYPPLPRCSSAHSVNQSASAESALLED